MPTEQIKTGKSITLIQLVISVVVVLSGAVGLYVNQQVAMAKMEQRLEVIEKGQAQWQSNALAIRQAREAEIKDLDLRVDKNSNDINILFATKKDK
jgi:DNA topoisomerase IA